MNYYIVCVCVCVCGCVCMYVYVSPITCWWLNHSFYWKEAYFVWSGLKTYFILVFIWRPLASENKIKEDNLVKLDKDISPRGKLNPTRESKYIWRWNELKSQDAVDIKIWRNVPSLIVIKIALRKWGRHFTYY